MNTRKIRSISFFLITGLVTTFLFNNCGDGFKKSGKMMHYDSSSTGTGGTGGTGGTAGKVTLSTTKGNNTSELGQTYTVPISIDRTGNMANKVLTLKVASPEIDAKDPMDGFVATISPTTLAVGQTAAIVTVNVKTSSPSFVEHFHVEAWDGNLIEAELEINTTVQPIVHMQVTGTGSGDGTWGINGQPSTNLFTTGTRDIPFIAHTGGLQVIFDNFSSRRLIVHSSNAIPHGNTTPGQELAPSPDAGVTKGGSYMPAKIMPTARTNAPVYHHLDENVNAARRLLFNANL